MLVEKDYRQLSAQRHLGGGYVARHGDALQVDLIAAAELDGALADTEHLRQLFDALVLTSV